MTIFPGKNERLRERKINPTNTETAWELAKLFFRMGFTAFGGPAAHIAMMEAEVVTRRGWFTHEEFLDMLAVTNLIPGPNSTEMAIHIGYRRAGVRGLLAAGGCFILPAMLVTMAFAWLYTSYGMVAAPGAAMTCVRAAVIAVILAAVWRLAKPLASKPFTIGAGGVTALLAAAGIDPLLLLAAAGAAGIAWTERRRIFSRTRSGGAIGAMLLLPAGAPAVAGGASLGGIALFFLKIGAILYGGGYVLVAFLQEGLVGGRGWLTESRLLDAIAVGQFTPGPILSTATFIGYLLAGVPGAVVSTVAIFFPSFVFVLIVGPFVPRLRKSPIMKGFLDGVNGGALGLMAGVCFTLGAPTLRGIVPWAVFGSSLLVQIRWRINPAWLIAAGALAGWCAAMT